MAFRPENFVGAKVTVGVPVKNTGDFDYSLMTVTYDGGKKPTFFFVDEVAGTRISENALKPGQLSQGFHLEKPDQVKLCSDFDDILLQAVFDNKDHADMPSWVGDCSTKEEIIKNAVKYKPLLHRPKKKDAKGKPTREIDETVEPMLYGSMIQCGPKHKDTPNKVYTKYFDNRILSPENTQKIKEGRLEEASFKFEAVDLWKAKTAMKAKPTIVVGEIHIDDKRNLKFRRSITEVYVVSFQVGESQARKGMREESAKRGDTFDGPALIIPGAPEEGGEDGRESGSDDDVVHNPVGGPKMGDDKEFKVQILGQ